MRSGQQNKRSRGRGNNNNSNNNNNNYNRKGSNPLTRTYDSSGPDVKIRGTAQYIAEKYAGLARDAQSSGDRVMAENYLQHAEHYNRIVASAQSQMQERFQRDERQDLERDMDDVDVGNESDDQVVAAAPVHAPAPAVIDGSGPQPVIEGTPVEVSIEEESGAAAQPAGGREKAPARRRSAGNRPRREPRTSNAEKAEGGEKAATGEAPPAPTLEAASE